MNTIEIVTDIIIKIDKNIKKLNNSTDSNKKNDSNKYVTFSPIIKMYKYSYEKQSLYKKWYTTINKSLSKNSIQKLITRNN